MRSSLIICLLVSLGSYVCFAQTTEKIPIPVLKESKKVDQLMDIVLDPNNADKFERSNNSTDSCFLIYFFKPGDNPYVFQIEKNTKAVTNTITNSLVRNPGLGIFQYKNYKVFVIAGNGFYDFFNRTDQTATFDFIYKLQTPAPLENEHFLAIWHYQYENGKFSVEGPPAVK
ncbi:MAG: hypothetical protein JST19_01185 [Bacteroidetes bacterium]|nr:hypothetical protein [Bacteroidota bacterium]